jgi:hypothetical protein
MTSTLLGTTGASHAELTKPKQPPQVNGSFMMSAHHEE